MNNFARFLNTIPQIDDFLTVALSLDIADLPKREFDSKFNIHSALVKCEKGVLDGIENPTSTSLSFRDKKYSNDTKRLELRKQIVDELFTKYLCTNDDNIILGKGGAIPKNVLKEKKAFVLIGLPASGKSSVAVKISKTFGAIILDSDFAKRKLPEYEQYDWGASLVNKESSMIVFGDKINTGFSSLFEKCVDNNYNIVIPKIGAEPDDIIPYCKSLNEAGYEVHLTLVYLPKQKATIRALYRFINTGRYVPLTLIFDVYGNNPALTYFKLKNSNPEYINSFGVVNTDVSNRQAFFNTDLQGNNPAKMYTRIKNVLI